MVPLTDGLDPVLLRFLLQIEAAERAIGEGRAEQVRAGRAGLRLMPDLAEFRQAHADAAVVLDLAGRPRREAPVDLKLEIAEFLVVPEPLVAGVAGADERLLRRVDAPLELGVDRADGWDRDPEPAVESFVRENVDAVRRAGREQRGQPRDAQNNAPQFHDALTVTPFTPRGGTRARCAPSTDR